MTRWKTSPPRPGAGARYPYQFSLCSENARHLLTSASSSFRRAEPEMQWVALPRGDRVPEARREKGQPFKRRLESTGTCQCLKPRGTVPRGGVRCSNHQPDLKIFTGYALSARSVGGGGVWGVRRGAVGSGTWDEGRGGEGWGWTISLL